MATFFFGSLLIPFGSHLAPFGSVKGSILLQIPERRATATNNQELPKTFRNLDSEIALPKFAVFHNASSSNKRMHQNAELQKWGAAVLAPHGAFGLNLEKN